MNKRVTFRGFWLPLLLLLPQLVITAVFFIWPASQALYQSVLLEDPFGLKSRFVWFDNFKALFADPYYLASFNRTAIFGLVVAGLAMGISLLLAAMADRVLRGASAYKSMLLWPYAVAPVVAGALWWFLFNPRIGIIAYVLQAMGYDWNHTLNGTDAQILVVVAAVWKQISYNFLFFLAGLQAIPRSLIEAAAIDGASPFKRFWTIIFPLLTPTAFFLLVVNIVYAFFDTFGIVHATTNGGPAKATEILVYKLYNDGFVGLDLGGSAAQSVILMVIVVALTVVQFRFIERRVEY
ncbi:MAG: sn-glycerol-3-phosphate ABC transporter permease UgpA [Hyphomicrobiaceae bacterium]